MQTLMFRREYLPSLFDSLDSIVCVSHITHRIFLCKPTRDRLWETKCQADREREKVGNLNGEEKIALGLVKFL